MKFRDELAILCLVLSGFAGLIYEVCWIRQAAVVFGVTTFAVSSVLAIFFLGLSIGSYVFGRVAQRARHPLRWYCLLEVLLAALALASPVAFVAADAVYGWCYRHGSVLSWAPKLGGLSVIVLTLVPPTILMGGTLPLFCQQLVTRREQITRTVGMLYGLNTLGAAAGCAITGLVFIPWLGVTNSIYVGATLSLLSAAGVAAVRWNAAVEVNGHAPRAEKPAGAPAIVLVLFFGSGFVALGNEVLWIRYLSLLVRNTVYTYSLTLTVVLVGIVLGSLLTAAIARRHEAPVVAFGATQILTGLCVSILMLLPPRAWEMLGQADLWVYLWLLLPPAAFAGAAFPLAIRVAVDEPSLVGGKFGSMVAVNTLGGIAGALTMGFIALPMAGLQTSLLLTTGLSVAVGIAAWLFCQRPARWQPRAVAAALAVAAWLAVHALSSTRIPQDFLAEFGQLVDFREGHNSNVAVIRRPDALRMEIDRWWQGEDRINHQIMAAHLPMLLHRQPREVLVVGAGTGQTASRFLLHNITRLDCVDIEPAVFDIIREHFAAAWMEDPRVHLWHEDGRALLAHGDATYDVISLELGQIVRPGVAAFYTNEFYQRARHRLKPSGLLCQFVPAPFFTPDEFRGVVGTFLDVFPQSTLWYNTSELLLIGCNCESFAINAEQLQRRLSLPRIHDDLRYSQWGGSTQWLNQWPVILGSFLAGPQQLAQLSAAAPRYHVDLPVLEYATSGRPIATTNELPIVELLRRFLIPVGSTVEGKLDADELATVDQMREKNLGDMVAVARLREVDRQKALGDYPGIIAALAEPLRLNPDHVKAQRVTADAHMLMGQLKTALQHYTQALAVSPADAAAQRGMAFCLHRMNRIDEAMPHYEAALRLQPEAEVHNNFGAALAARGQLQRAIWHFREALRLDPRHADADRNLARALSVLRPATDG